MSAPKSPRTPSVSDDVLSKRSPRDGTKNHARVNGHYPGEPKPGYIAPWEEMPDWEQASAQAVFEQVRGFVVASGGSTSNLTREQKGRFVALCWIGQVFHRIENPKHAYVADWAYLPEWQKETDADIFEHIEQTVAAQ